MWIFFLISSMVLGLLDQLQIFLQLYLIELLGLLTNLGLLELWHLIYPRFLTGFGTLVFLTNLKLVSAIFYQTFDFNQMIALQKLWKMFFISSKKLFSLLRIYIFVFSSSPLFLLVSHCFRGWSKKNHKIYDVINCLCKNLITHFVCYLEKEIRCDIETLSIDRELNKEHFYGKIMQKMCTKC